jgi:hypothetical protein
MGTDSVCRTYLGKVGKQATLDYERCSSLRIDKLAALSF